MISLFNSACESHGLFTIYIQSINLLRKTKLYVWNSNNSLLNFTMMQTYPDYFDYYNIHTLSGRRGIVPTDVEKPPNPPI